MPYLKSANPDARLVDVPTGDAAYDHGAQQRRSAVPLAFQITSPFDDTKVLLPHALVAHINPQSFSETFSKKIERITTKGGFVEQHWPDELGDINIDQSTGAFMNVYTGLTSVVRHKTIAYDRYLDLVDLYRNNGSLYDPRGNVVLQGKVMLMYDRGVYIGHFTNFQVEETDDSPFAFKLSYTFKVERTILKIPLNRGPLPNVPAFQGQNRNAAPTYLPAKAPINQTPNGAVAGTASEVKRLADVAKYDLPPSAPNAGPATSTSIGAGGGSMSPKTAPVSGGSTPGSGSTGSTTKVGGIPVHTAPEEIVKAPPPTPFIAPF